MKILIALLLLSSLASAAAPLETLPIGRHISGQYVVLLHAGHAPADVANTHALVRHFTYRHALNGFSARVPEARLAALKKDHRVRLVEEDVEVVALAQTVPTGVRRIGCAQTNGVDARMDVDIAILDTGIDLTHPDLNVYRGVSFTTDNSTGNDPVQGHGTHCAGIAAALNNGAGVVGVAPGARLWAVKVLGDTGSGALSGVIAGVDYVTEHALEIEVVNMSLGGLGQINSLRYAISNSVARGVVYVVAAGNSSYNVYGSDRIFGTADDFFPAAYPECMTVTALVDTDGKAGGLGVADGYGADDTLATFSNYGTEPVVEKTVSSPGGAVDLAAPGVNIYSTYKGGSYAYMSGTSMASPHAAGAVALHVSMNGRAQNADNVRAIRQALVNGATAQTNWGVNAPNPNPYKDFFAEGLLNVAGLRPGTNLPPVPIPVPVKELKAWVSTDRGFYYNRQRVYVSALVTDGAGTVWGANVRITVKSPNGKTVLFADVPSNSVGEAGASFTINSSRDGRGTYTVTAVASKAGYTNGAAQTNFGT